MFVKVAPGINKSPLGGMYSWVKVDAFRLTTANTFFIEKYLLVENIDHCIEQVHLAGYPTFHTVKFLE